MDDETKRVKESAADRRQEAVVAAAPGPVRPASPVFHRTDISHFVEDAKARIGKGFDDRVGELSEAKAASAPLLVKDLQVQGND